VDVEPEPVGEENYLGRNRRNGVVIVLAEETKINLGEGVDLGDAAKLKNLCFCPLQRWMLWLISGELEAEIRLDRRADVRRGAVIDGPAAVFVLMSKNVVGAFLE